MQIRRCVNCMDQIELYPCPKCGFDAAARPQPGYALPWETILHGKFLVGRMLGQGGFGITYVGWDLALEVKVAIKEYYPAGQVSRQSSLGGELVWNSTAQSETARQTGMESFLKEARKMARVDRVPEVVRVRETFYENGTAYIIMDFVEGETLKARLEREGPLPFGAAMDIFRPVLNAMEQVHQAGLIHRDLSPDNIMLEPGGGVRILDLGAAKDLAVNRGASSMLVTKGGFSPVEQYGQRGGSGPWTDVYAMAATIYYTLTGVVPPNAIDRLEEDELRWDLPALQALPGHAREALQNALAVSAKARTQSMAALLAGLEQSAPEPEPVPTPAPKPTPKPAPAPEPPPPPRPEPEPGPKPRKKPWIGLGICAAVAVVVIVAAAWALGGGEDSADDPGPAASDAGTVEPAPSEAPVPTPEPAVPAVGSTPEPVPDAVSSPEPDIAPEPVPDAVPSPEPDIAPEPVPSAGPSPEPDVTPAPVPAATPPPTAPPPTPEPVDEIAGGQAGPSVTWSLSSKGVLTLAGSGATDNYHFDHSNKAPPWNTDITALVVGSGVTKIGYKAFYGCDNLSSITLPESLTEIATYAFGDCTGLTSVTIPEGVIKIDRSAFYGCTSLTSVSLPASLRSIDEGPFTGCTSLTDVYYGGTETQWQELMTTVFGFGDDPLFDATIHTNS